MNRFTEKLDDAHCFSNGYIAWLDILEILPRDFVGELTELRETMSFQEFTPVKALLLCFIAEMSDEDLKECFGI